MTAGETALRDHYRSSLAMSALNPDGTINPTRASAWADNHAEILAQFPAIRRELTILSHKHVAASRCRSKRVLIWRQLGRRGTPLRRKSTIL
jgi:hypothetical protein